MVLVRVEELNTRSRVHFSTSYNQFHLYGTHVMVSVSRSILCATRGYRDQDRYRAHHSGNAGTATAYVRAHLVTHVRIKPPSVLSHACGDDNGPLDDGRIARREHGWPTLTRSQNGHSTTSEPSPIARTSTAATTWTITNTPKSWRHCY